MKEDKNRQNYDDIINLPHHVSLTHPPMQRAERAAQFSPFAALTGFEEAVRETGRLTEVRKELGEDAGLFLNEKLQSLTERIKDRPEAEITYFQPDNKKEGGSYITVKGLVKKVDTCGQKLIMGDGIQIPVGEIIEIKDSSLRGNYN